MKTRITYRKFHRVSGLAYWVLSCRSPVDGANYSVELAELSSNLQRGCDSRKSLADRLRQARKLLRERALQPRAGNLRDDNVKFYLILGRLFLAKDTNTPPKPSPRQIAEWLDEGLRLHVLPALAGPHAIRQAYAAGWQARGVAEESSVVEAPPTPADPIRTALERLLERLDETSEPGDPVIPAWIDSYAAARAVLAATSADGPAVPEGREPASVDGEPSDEELLEIKDGAYCPSIDEVNDEDDSSWQYTSDYIRSLDENGTPQEQEAYEAKGLRAVFEAGRRWGRPAPPPAEGEVELLKTLLTVGGESSLGYKLSPEQCRRLAALLRQLSATPPTPAAGEVGELVAWLTEQAVRAADCNQPMAAGMLTWAAEVAGEHADLLERQAAPVLVSERLPEPSVKVLAHYFNDLGKGRTICAIWVPAKTRSDSYGNDDFTEYDEETDAFYWPEGWYEAIENWDDLGYVKVDEGDVIYWQPLPQWPAPALPLPSGEEAND